MVVLVAGMDIEWTLDMRKSAMDRRKLLEKDCCRGLLPKNANEEKADELNL